MLHREVAIALLIKQLHAAQAPPPAPAAARLGQAADRATLPPPPRHSAGSAGGNAAPTCRAARRPRPPLAAVSCSAPAPLRTSARIPPITRLPAASPPPEQEA